MRKKYQRVPKDPQVESRINEAAKSSTLPQYAIKNLIVRGALSPTLDSENDSHVIQKVLPCLIGNKAFLTALMSHIGSRRARQKFLEQLKEEFPFHNYIRGVIEEWHAAGRPLVVKKIIIYLRTCGGAHSTYARNCTDEKLTAAIYAIKNKVFCRAARDKTKKKPLVSETPTSRKRQFLLHQLVKISGRPDTSGDSDLQLHQISLVLDAWGGKKPDLVSRAKETLREMAIEARSSILAGLPENLEEHQISRWIMDNYSRREFGILTAFADERGLVAGPKITTLSRVLYGQWRVMEMVRRHNLFPDC